MAEPSVARNTARVDYGPTARRVTRNWDSIPRAAREEIMRTARQAANLNTLLNRTRTVTYWDGGEWEAPVYNMDNPRRRDGRYRTRNGEVLPSEYDRRQQVIERAVLNRLNRIRQRYSL